MSVVIRCFLFSLHCDAALHFCAACMARSTWMFFQPPGRARSSSSAAPAPARLAAAYDSTAAAASAHDAGSLDPSSDPSSDFAFSLPSLIPSTPASDSDIPSMPTEKSTATQNSAAPVVSAALNEMVYLPGGMNAGMVLVYLMEMGVPAAPGVGHAVVAHTATFSVPISIPLYLISTAMLPPVTGAMAAATVALTSKAASAPGCTGSGSSFTSVMVMDPSPQDFHVAGAPLDDPRESASTTAAHRNCV
mmetsp:Transcript_1241/g.2884  ORF Transcript_1241/g.2884 Transcript_1241/m.2884 type:complete len:248 (+) Transcript_1241:175-918(+)